jgi:hypothetical protein
VGASLLVTLVLALVLVALVVVSGRPPRASLCEGRRSSQGQTLLLSLGCRLPGISCSAAPTVPALNRLRRREATCWAAPCRRVDITKRGWPTSRLALAAPHPGRPPPQLVERLRVEHVRRPRPLAGDCADLLAGDERRQVSSTGSHGRVSRYTSRPSLSRTISSELPAVLKRLAPRHRYGDVRARVGSGHSGIGGSADSGLGPLPAPDTSGSHRSKWQQHDRCSEAEATGARPVSAAALCCVAPACSMATDEAEGPAATRSGR